MKKLLVCFQGTGSGTTVRTFDGTTWTTIAGYTPVAGYNVEIVQGLDKLYLTDTTQNIFSWDGAAWSQPRQRRRRCTARQVHRVGEPIASSPPGAECTGYRLLLRFARPQLDPLECSQSHPRRNRRRRSHYRHRHAFQDDPRRVQTHADFLVDINPSLSVSTFTIDEVPTTYGCVHYRTIAKVETTFGFVQRWRALLSRTLQGDDSSVSAPISLPIKTSRRSSPDTYLELTNATYFQGRYLLAHWANFTAPDGTPTGYYTLSYNVELQQWEGRWDGLLTVLMTQTRFAGILRLVFAATTGTLTYFRHENGTPRNRRGLPG